MKQPEQFENLDEKRIIKVDLDEQVILATDESGEELLRLAVECGDKLITFRFPAYGVWDLYCKRIQELFIRLSSFGSELEMNLPENMQDILKTGENPSAWAIQMAIALRPKFVGKLVEHIFFRFLRPAIDGKPITKEWARENLGIDQLIRMFAAILFVDHWVKKNTHYLLETMFQAYQAPGSSPILPKNLGGNLLEFKKPVFSKFVSF